MTAVDTWKANPLLEGLTPFIPVSEMPSTLINEPLEHMDWRSVRPELREQYLALHDHHFFPTRLAVDIGVRLQAALLGSLVARNPCDTGEQRRINQLALLECKRLPDTLTGLANPASGGIIAARTGLGKTSIVKRALEVIAPSQVMIHSRSEVAGWSKLVQIAYLRLDFPSNGTRGGLVERILAEVDQLVGTDYSSASRRLRNLDASLVLVMKVLSCHRVGMLVLDELQMRNFDECQWRTEFVMFLLCLLNLGIPLVLCGQPGAFTAVREEDQTLRRFSTIGYFTLHRAATNEDAWWANEFVKGVMRFNLCEQIDQPGEIVTASRHLAAGVPGYFVALWIEAQRLALRRREAAAKITPADVHNAVAADAIGELMRLVRNIEPPETQPPGGKENAPPNTDGSHIVAKGKPARTSRTTDSPLTQAVNNARRAERRRQQEEARTAARTEEFKKTLPPDDVRLANHALELLAGLDQYQEDMLRPNGTSNTNAAINTGDGAIPE